MRRTRRAVAVRAGSIALAVLAVGCGGSVPASRFYVLDYEVAKAAGAGADIVLGVEGFSTPRLYADRRIAYRASAHEVVYYPSHYWAAAPGDLVAEQLARHIRQAGVVRAVEPPPFSRRLDWLLGGSVEAFEEVEAGGQSVARIVLIVRLESVADRRLLHEEEIRAERPVRRRSPEQVAAAMSDAVAAVGARVLEIIEQEATRH